MFGRVGMFILGSLVGSAVGYHYGREDFDSLAMAHSNLLRYASDLNDKVKELEAKAGNIDPAAA